MTLFVAVGVATTFAQNTNISGVVNRYTRVMVVDRCNSSIVVRNPVGFAAGDDVLIIQMKGATIDHTNSPAFGDVTVYHAAGNYELAVMDSRIREHRRRYRALRSHLQRCR